VPRLTGISPAAFPDAEAALDRRLDPESEAPIGLALSGGGDSMALLHLAQVWARRRRRRILALSVDHGLHPDSSAWTAFAGEAARAVGAEWRPLRWTGPKPTTGLPAAARVARHKLLADATREAGAAVILFAHTRDDVAEADLMRKEAAPTLGYLRDWSPSPVWPQGRGVFALRPLLGVGRAALRRYLRAEGRSWLDDPANDDLRFARARSRLMLASSPAAGDTPPFAPYDQGLAAIAQTANPTIDGRIEMARSDLLHVEAHTLRRLLSIAAVCAAGAASPPRGDGLARVADLITRANGFVATLAGARIASDGTTVSFAREAGDLGREGVADLDLNSGEQAIWDGRFEIAAEAPITVAALSGKASRLSKRDRERVGAFPAVARPSVPIILRGGEAHLPRPFGEGPAHARALAAERFTAACGLIGHERDISPPRTAQGMAQARRSSYVEALALA
jgi:tRNA(Ile)-lysidine synthase